MFSYNLTNAKGFDPHLPLGNKSSLRVSSSHQTPRILPDSTAARCQRVILSILMVLHYCILPNKRVVLTKRTCIPDFSLPYTKFTAVKYPYNDILFRLFDLQEKV